MFLDSDCILPFETVNVVEEIRKTNLQITKLLYPLNQLILTEALIRKRWTLSALKVFKVSYKVLSIYKFYA